MHYLRTHAGQGAWQTGRAGGKQAEDALPGWSCLGSIGAVGAIYLEKGETDPEAPLRVFFENALLSL